MESLLDFALAYAELGYYVFPCHTPIKKEGFNCTCEIFKRKHDPDYECSRAGKHPRSKHGLDDATTDPDQIRQWWKRWPTANIGINCGLSGLLVVDLDSYKDLYEGHDLDLDEETITALSGGGGSHLIYRMEDGDLFGNSNKQLPDGIDIRGHGGYIVAAPSLHESGNVYQWELEYSPWDREPAPIPAELRRVLEETMRRPARNITFDTTIKYNDGRGTAYGIAAINKYCAAITGALNGTRNNTLNEGAFVLGRLVSGGELEYSYARDSVYAAAVGVGLSDAEATQTIDSAMEAGANDPLSSIAMDEVYDGFGECPDPALLFGEEAAAVEELAAGPVHLSEVQVAIEQMFRNGQPLEEIREAHWKAIGNLGVADRRVLSKFLYDLGLFATVKKAGAFVDDCATSLSKIPLIERITEAIMALGHEFRMNELEDTIEVDGERMKDTFMSRLFLLMEDKKFNQRQVTNAVNVLAERNSYHPVRDYLLGLEWDGEDHLSEFFSYITGDDKVVQYADGREIPMCEPIIKRWLLGCVARAIDGGNPTAFKHQTPVLVLMGAQGRGKSSLIRWMASGVGYEYHKEGPVDPHNSNDIRSMVKVWLWEIAELSSSLKKTDRDAFKSFVTQEWHTYRKPYDRYDITKPALCNLAGTLNPENGFLDDPTGHRRFLPVTLTNIDWAYSENVDINQLWAQVVALYLMGESPELEPEEKEVMLQVYTENEVEDPLRTYIRMYFRVEPENETIRTSTAEILNRLKDFNIVLHPDMRVAGRKLAETLSPMGMKSKRWDGNATSGWSGIEPNNKTPFSKF